MGPPSSNNNIQNIRLKMNGPVRRRCYIPKAKTIIVVLFLLALVRVVMVLMNATNIVLPGELYSALIEQTGIPAIYNNEDVGSSLKTVDIDKKIEPKLNETNENDSSLNPKEPILLDKTKHVQPSGTKDTITENIGEELMNKIVQRNPFQPLLKDGRGEFHHYEIRRNNSVVHLPYFIPNRVLPTRKPILEERRNATSLENFFLHLPKAGGVGTKYLLNGDANQMLLEKIITEPYMVCDEGLTSIENWNTFQTSFKKKTRKNVNAKRCVMSMSESYYHPVFADNIFTVVRNPQEHVLSMYFHCTESKHHKLKTKMPSLDEWLEHWASFKEAYSTSKTRAEWTFKQFNCFNPINMQSRLLGYPRTKDDLKDRFRFVGVLSELDTSTCIMAQHLSGATPSRCNCNDRRRRLVADHGVVHHGSTYNTTNSQRELIDILTDMDQILYKEARTLFEEEVQLFEKEHGFTLCRGKEKNPNIAKYVTKLSVERGIKNPWQPMLKDRGEIQYYERKVNGSFVQLPYFIPNKVFPTRQLIVEERMNTTSLGNFFIHLPKTGGVGTKNMIGKDARDMWREKIITEPYVVCDEGLTSIENWKTFKTSFTMRKKNNSKINCVMSMSESYYHPVFADNIFTVVRNPQEHVLSMYFHCTESRSHIGKNKMPSLDGWLESWVSQKEQLSQTNTRVEWLPNKFNCYNPINMQSRLLGYPRTKNDLKDRFRFVGVLSELDTSTCIMAQHLSGATPSRCNCNDKRRRLVADHGVIHHGSTYNTTNSQRELIDILTDMDQILYKEARTLFEEEVQLFEKEHGFTLCRGFNKIPGIL